MRKLKTVIAPSILSADFGILYEQCKSMLDYGADSLHIDIMDGHFVPNLTIGAPVVQSLRKHLPHAHFDCHLMVSYPEDYINPLNKAKINCFTFHYQAQYQDLKGLCDKIRQSGMEVGLSIKPKTQINQEIENLIIEEKIDKLLVMTVEPGFGGQKFMTDMMPKVKYLRNKFPELNIQVDGGISCQNIEQVAANGANCIVSGSGIFGVQHKQKAISFMRQKVQGVLKI